MDAPSPVTASRLGNGAGRHPALPYAAVVVGVLLVYANALRADFLGDDWPLLHHAGGDHFTAAVASFFTTPHRLNPVVAPVETQVYRPMYYVYATLALRLWGARPWAWHAANVVLHALVACLVLVAMRRLFDLPPGAALLAALLWAVHPVHVQPAANVAAVAYLLMGLFLLLAVLLASVWWPPGWPGPLRVLAALGAFALSVLHHELGLMAPALAALVLAASPGAGWIWGHRPARSTVAAAVGMGVAAALYIVLRLTLVGAGQAGQLSETARSLGLRLLQAPEVLLRYLGLLAVPVHLRLERSQDVPLPAGLADPRALVAVVACVLLVWGVVHVARRVPAAGFGGAWFILAYLPTSNTLIPLYSLMGEQYMYIASVGVVGGAVAAARAAARATGVLRYAALLGILLVAAYGARSAFRVLDWHDEVTLLQATVQASPRNAFYRSQLGHTHSRRGRLDFAEREFRAVIELTPSDPNAHLDLGNVLLGRGNLDEAESAFRQAIAVGPDSAEGYYGMAVLSHRRGDDRNETLWLEMASARPAARVETALNMGLAYLQIDPRRAALHLRRFLALAPGHPQVTEARALLLALPSAADR